ncbi:hypothetical protein [Aquimarina sp. 2201CG14-23]|uniref:hypothetical protein n=1 Tax=Aquimarina mycalae TaxID=3040073 RepID=UPI002477EFBD|nr:hypothetical protein [Aquimarina sp. 2201CG14-23]MDH7445673.1 hypothetical protein [Aquimarina sp. 2201CG14-23]
MIVKSLFIKLMVCFLSMFLSHVIAQEDELKINYKDSITVIDSLIYKGNSQIRIFKIANNLALNPYLKLAEDIKIKNQINLKRLKRKLRKDRITKSEFDKQKYQMDSVLNNITTIINQKSSMFDDSFSKVINMDSLQKRREYFVKKMNNTGENK